MFSSFSLGVVAVWQELVFLMEMKDRSGSLAVFVLIDPSKTRDRSVAAIACSDFNCD